MARVVSITGGKEGVGATFVSLNIAFCLSVMGYRTCLLFTDPGFSKGNLPLDVSPRGDIAHVLNGESSLNDIITNSSENLDVMFSGNAFESDRCIEPDQVKRLSDSFFHAVDYDFFIIDTLAGPSKNTISFCMAASEPVLVFTPEPPVITSAYALVKALGSNGFSGQMAAVVNQSKNTRISDLAVTKLNESAEKSFQIKIAHLANITKDASVSRSTISRRIFVRQNPDAAAAKDLQKIADRLKENKLSGTGEVGLDDFWKAYFTFCTVGGSTSEKLKEKKSNEKSDASPWVIAPEEPITLMKQDKPSSISPDPDIDPGFLSGNSDNPLEVLAKSLFSLTRELHALRSLVQSQNLFQNKPPSDAYSTPRQKIELDFDSFLSSRLK